MTGVKDVFGRAESDRAPRYEREMVGLLTLEGGDWGKSSRGQMLELQCLVACVGCRV